MTSTRSKALNWPFLCLLLLPLVGYGYSLVPDRGAIEHPRGRPQGRLANPRHAAQSLNNEFLVDTSIVCVPEPGSDQYYPAVGYDGTNYLAVWEDGLAGSSDIYGTRIGQTGQVLDPGGILIASAADDQVEPAVAFDGSDYQVIWQDDRNAQLDIYGAKLNRQGQVIEDYDVSLQPGEQNSPALAAGSGGLLLIAYSGWAEAEQGRKYNAIRTWGKLYPFTGIKGDETGPSPLPGHGSISVHPNPVGSGRIILIRTAMRLKCISVYDVAGKLVRQESPAPGREPVKKVSLKGIRAGVYLLKLETEDRICTAKLVVN